MADMRRAAGLAALTAFVVSTGLALAEDGQTFGFCQDEAQKGWNYYCDPKRAKKTPAPIKPAPASPVPAASPDAQPSEPRFPATAAIEAQRKELDELRNRAVLEPSPENVKVYMAAQAKMIDQATTFADIWQRVLFKSPELDANKDYPLTSIGGEAYQDRKRGLYEEALREAAANLGFMVVVTDEQSCALCGPQLEVIKLMQANYGISPLVITKDGSHHPLFPEAKLDTGQLKKLGLAGHPTPFVALVEPISGAVEPLGSGLLTEDLILERIYLITRVPAGAAFATSPLDAPVRPGAPLHNPPGKDQP